jgi:hypothetical protein
MELRKQGPNRFAIVGKLKRGYHTEWENAFYRDVEAPASVARSDLRRYASVVAAERGVPPSHVEFA